MILKYLDLTVDWLLYSLPNLPNLPNLRGTDELTGKYLLKKTDSL